MEDRATTTEQNLRFSRDVADAAGRPGPLLVVTNGYHVPRAALISRRIGVDADVIGARTAKYFVPSAYIREFIAIVVMHRWLHVGLVVAEVAFAVLIAAVFAT